MLKATCDVRQRAHSVYGSRDNHQILAMSMTTCNCPRTWLRSCSSLFAEPGLIQLRDPLCFLCLLLQVFQNLKQPDLKVCRHFWVAISTAGLAIGHKGRYRKSERCLLSWHNISIQRTHVTGVYVPKGLNTNATQATEAHNESKLQRLGQANQAEKKERQKSC